MAIFTGSGVAIVTPFNEDGSIDFNAYEKILDFQIENGTDAVIVCGTTGEASTLRDDEQLEVIRFTVEKVNKRIPVIAGAGSNDTEHGILLCKGSQKAGADACLLVTPYYNKTTQKGLVKHFSALAASIDIPIMLYNIPIRTGLNIAPKTACELSTIENIVAIKEASDNIVQIGELAALCGDRMDIYSGNDNQILPILSLGGKGVVSVAANIVPRQVHDLVMAYLDGDRETSLRLQLEILPLVRALFCEVNPIPIKAAMNLMGMQAGGYRAPLVNMEEENHALLKREMQRYGLL